MRWTPEQADAHQAKMGQAMTIAEYTALHGAKPSEPKQAKRLRKVSLEPSEADIEATAVSALRSCGYVVLITGRTNVPVVCKKCGTKTWGSPTNDIGTPDVFVSHPIWNGLFLALEFKEPNKGKASEKQADLAEKGYSRIVKSVFSALSSVYMMGNKNFNMDDGNLFNAAQSWYSRAKEQS